MKSRQNSNKHPQPRAKTRTEQIPSSTSNQPTDRFLAKHEVLDMLKMSPRTLQEWRNKKLIEFTRIGGKIFYSLNSILRTMQDGMQKVVIGGWAMVGIWEGICDWMEMVA